MLIFFNRILLGTYSERTKENPLLETYLVKVCVSVLPGLVYAVVPGGRGHDRRDGRNDQIPELLITIVFFLSTHSFAERICISGA